MPEQAMTARELLHALAELPPHRLDLPVEIDLNPDGAGLTGAVLRLSPDLYCAHIQLAVDPDLLQSLIEADPAD